MGELMEGFETFTPAERSFLDGKSEVIPTGDEAPVDDADETEPDEVEASEDAEPEAEEAKAEDEAPEEDKPKRKDQRIPLRKLQESENQRRELEKRLAEREEAFARADERLRTLMTLAQPQEQPKAPAVPDPKDDPIGFMEWQKGEVERLSTEQRQQQEAYQQQAQINAIDTAYKQSWGVFATEKPDALDAYQHFVNVTAAYLEMQGVPQQQINDLVQNEERKITVAAMQRGINPAEMIYEKARTFGYAPKAVAAPSEDVARKAEADIARRNKASAASKSLSSAGGSRAGSMPTMEELANMPEEEFAEFRNKVGDRQFRKLMGG